MADPVIDLAKLAVAWERAHSVYFPSSAREMAELGSQILLKAGIQYWISPGGDSIICVKCRHTSHNKYDVREHYCGFCRDFLFDSV